MMRPGIDKKGTEAVQGTSNPPAERRAMDRASLKWSMLMLVALHGECAVAIAAERFPTAWSMVCNERDVLDDSKRDPLSLSVEVESINTPEPHPNDPGSEHELRPDDPGSERLPVGQAAQSEDDDWYVPAGQMLQSMPLPT
jgi:hypothetical protein